MWEMAPAMPGGTWSACFRINNSQYSCAPIDMEECDVVFLSASPLWSPLGCLSIHKMNYLHCPTSSGVK